MIATEPVNWWAVPPPAISLAPGFEPEPNLLLPEKFAETPSIKLKPEKEKILPPRAISLSTCMFEAVIPPLALIWFVCTLSTVIVPLALIFPPTVSFSVGRELFIPKLPVGTLTLTSAFRVI